MRYELGIEDMERDHWIAWALDFFGCYHSARTQEEAVEGAPAAIVAYFNWLAGCGHPHPLAAEPVETRIAQVFRAFPDPDDANYIVNAFFEHDRRPLTDADVEQAFWLLDCTRRDLLAVIDQIPSEKLAEPIPGLQQGAIFKGTIDGVLDHMAISEWWYFDRLGLAFDRRDMPADPLERLETVRVHAREQLPKLIDDERVVVASGEQWSGRKLLRRMLWHERDHTQQIAKLAHLPGTNN